MDEFLKCNDCSLFRNVRNGKGTCFYDFYNSREMREEEDCFYNFKNSEEARRSAIENARKKKEDRKV